MRLGKKTTSFAEARRGRRGFTLVELIVVLTILAILAAIGLASVAGYINKSKFDQNSQNAITVYQTAQTALSQKTSNGTIDVWAQQVLAVAGVDLGVGGLENTNESIHKTAALTYNPRSSNNEQDRKLYELLYGYFYDQSIFNGTIAVEFDISATYGVDGPHYSAVVISAFYSNENDADTGWSDLCKAGADPYDGLPNRDANYRFTKSHVGYFNGSESSIKPQISSVILPQSELYDLDGHVIGPTDDPNATGYLFNLRNGETLDVTWALFDEDGQLHDSHNEDLTITLSGTPLIFNGTAENLGNSGTFDNVVLTIDGTAMSNVTFSTDFETVHEKIGNWDITRTTRNGLIDVNVQIGSEINDTYTFPITISQVHGDGRTGCPKDPTRGDGESPADYYEYRLSLDCMMVRSNETDDKTDRYNIDRLFGNTPRNIYATLEGHFFYVDKDGATARRDITKTYAARAIDDPAYFTKIDLYGGHTTYFYTVDYHLVPKDGEDGINETNGSALTGRCVVNTHFGDLRHSSTSTVACGTTWTSSGGSAVITAFRHLYNIRWITTGTVDYRIIRDLDWYVSKSGVSKVSEVRVYSLNSYDGKIYHIPAYNNTLYLVSFPAIGELRSGQSLSSMSVANGRIYSINNVQMRLGSFSGDTDVGYGLICKNSGTIYNIYTNNLNLVLADKPDSYTNDYNFICPETVSLTKTDSWPIGSVSSNRVGGLVGYNVGLVGSDTVTDVNTNTIRMSNTVVMAGNYWSVGYYQTGGVIGLNVGKKVNNVNVSTFGSIELRGAFIIVGGGFDQSQNKNASVGGIIGDNKANVGARLVVDGNPVQGLSSTFTMPTVSPSNAQVSCVIAGFGQVGGAIGWTETYAFNSAVNRVTSTDVTTDSITGTVVFPERNRNDYNIDVVLPERALVLKLAGNDTRCVGGAIGKINNGSGEYLSIRVLNSGNIVTTDTNMTVSCGGAIGEDSNSSILTTYINVTNAVGSRVGSMNSNSGPVRSGGAYGNISVSGNTDRTVLVCADNNGFIIAGGSGNCEGAGGAIGGCVDNGHISFLIRAINNSNSCITGVGDNISKGNGVGGAIGGMGNDSYNGNTEFLSSTYIYVENSGTINGYCHVGGAVGNAPKNNGSIAAVNSGTITGTSFVGGTVGRMSYANFGSVRSVLNGATINGTDFVGGAAGRISSFNDAAVVRTTVRGDSTVKGTGSLVGGICGDIRIAGTGNGGTIELAGSNTDPVLTVTGSDGVGGAVGLMRSELINKAEIVTPDQTTTNKLAVHVTGVNRIGGVVGCLRSANNSANESNVSNLLTSNAIVQDILVTINVKFNPGSYVWGTGENVGGAVGYITGKFDGDNFSKFGGIIRVSTSSGSTTSESAYIKGYRNVGGAIGHFYNVVPAVSATVSDGCISADYSSANWSIIATATLNNEANVGGAVGYFEGVVEGKKAYGTNDNSYPISANLGSTSVTSDGYNVGGVIGRNRVRNGIISANISGTVSGQYNVGGAIGSNEYRFNEANATVLASGTIMANGVNPNNATNNMADGAKGNGSNVGGAVGYYNFSENDLATTTSVISANISGTVTGPGDNVGGAVGYCYSNKVSHSINTITAVLQGASVVRGANNVGGAIGFSLSNIANVQSNISGSSNVIGNYRVGGAIGWTYAVDDQSGDNVYNRKTSGRIDSITATISADYALQGNTYIGGAVGQSGYKTLKNGNHWVSPALVSVTAVVNSGYLFDPFETGDPNGDACVGGVIGLVVDGRVEAVRLSGSGGTVNTDNRYPCSAISESGAVLIAASGNSVGGIIGQIGLESTVDIPLTGNNAQKVTVSNISSDDNLHLCVVSMNGSNRIGGWIGSAFGKYGGLGNRTANDYNSNKRATYNVNNVRFVYSRGDYVGGFCGYSRGHGPRETYLVINVNLNNATVTGRNGVGGVFGMVYAVNFKLGSITVALNNHTVIGDSNGSSLCQEAGGAIGSLYQNKDSEGDNPICNIPITVTIDSTSHIWSEGGNSDTSNYGVGGVLGRAYGEFGANGTLRVTATNPDALTVYSHYSNVGGVVGVMDNVQMKLYTSSSQSWAEGVTVRTDGDYACAGGFVGRINTLASDMYYCYCRGRITVYANGAHACAGGFAGYTYWASDARKIAYCYTTAEVRSLGIYTGGFIGQMLRGTISNCYVGGRTYQGYYVSGEGNVTGVGNVGGFIGAVTGGSKVTIDNCYSTASVLGTADNVGGFVGSTSNNTFVSNNYCTGRVIGPNASTCGAFAGVIGKLDNFSSNQAMALINPEEFPLVGTGLTATIPSTRIALADDSAIRDTHSDTGHPFDTSVLSSSFALRAVIGTDHYGDWPIPVRDPSIEDAHVMIYVKIGEDEEGNPIYDWVDFDDNTFSFEFNGSAVVLDDIIKVDLHQVPLYIDQQYVTYYRQNTAVGTATITISAKSGSGYSGAINRTFTITTANIEGADAVLTEPSREYSGARIYPDRQVTYHGIELEYLTDYYLDFDRDGDIESGFDHDNISIGKVYVYVVGRGNYGGVKCIGQFEILPIDLSCLSDDDIDTIGAAGLVYDEVNGVPVAYCPGVVVRYHGNTLNGTTDPTAQGYDYVVSYEHNDAAGDAYIVITGTADPSVVETAHGIVYTGVRRVRFTIAPAINVWTQEPTITGWTYGQPVNAPTGTVKYGQIAYDYYYDVDCQNRIENINAVGAGDYYVKVYAEASDNYSSPVPFVLGFTIAPAPITGARVVITPSEYPYTGLPITIDKSHITVTVGEDSEARVLSEDDYEITAYDPSESTGPGEVTLIVTGVGNYTGTASGAFTIYREFTITFNSNGGSSVNPEIVREGATVTCPDDPTRTNYRFLGWYSDAALEHEYNFSTEVAEAFTLYAKWVRVHTVTFITGDGAQPFNPQQTVDEGATVTRPADDPTRDGYVFRRWCSDAACQNEFNFNTQIWSDDVCIYADWVPLYTVHFVVGEGADPVPADQSVAAGETPTVPASPSRDGYYFLGWFTSAASDAPEYDFSSPIVEPTIIYAHWEEI